MEFYVDLNSLCISLDKSVRNITKVACMGLSGALENGLYISQNTDAHIVIYNNRIEFGQCLTPELSETSGWVFGNFYKEYSNIVYRYGCNYKCSFWSKQLDYVGSFPPSTPDNPALFELIYPKFA